MAAGTEITAVMEMAHHGGMTVHGRDEPSPLKGKGWPPRRKDLGETCAEWMKRVLMLPEGWE